MSTTKRLIPLLLMMTFAMKAAVDGGSLKGTVKYDGINNIDLHLTKRLTIETGTTRILAEVLMAANNRLYITQAETALNVPPPAIFQAALQILEHVAQTLHQVLAAAVERVGEVLSIVWT